MTRSTRRYDVELFLARVKYWAWYIITKICLGIVCIGIVSEGLRMFVPALGQKLYRLPGFGFLRNYEETHSLDIAPFLAFFFVISVWYLIEKMLKLWLPSDSIDRTDVLWNGEKEMKIVTAMACVLITVDCVLFYTAIARMRWGASMFSFSALLATLAYLSVLVFVSYVSAKLHGRVAELKALSELSHDVEVLEPQIQGEAA